MLADGGEAIADIDVLPDKRGGGPVASPPTAWRALDTAWRALDEVTPGGPKKPPQRGPGSGATSGHTSPAAYRAPGPPGPTLGDVVVLDVDAMAGIGGPAIASPHETPDPPAAAVAPSDTSTLRRCVATTGQVRPGRRRRSGGPTIRGASERRPGAGRRPPAGGRR